MWPQRLNPSGQRSLFTLKTPLLHQCPLRLLRTLNASRESAGLAFADSDVPEESAFQLRYIGPLMCSSASCPFVAGGKYLTRNGRVPIGLAPEWSTD
jgi:hypothetical protein